VEQRKLLEGEEKFTIPRCPELVENKAIPACLRVASERAVNLKGSL
jgi:thymidylate synthase ThyX